MCEADVVSSDRAESETPWAKKHSSALPRVSVVMPVYNGERYVADAVASVLAQTHRDFELIIIDDGSFDSTPEILATLAARDSRILIVTQTNQGQAEALNRALALAQYEWVAIHDHDDLSSPRRLESQLSFLSSHPNARVLGTYAVEIDEQGKEIGVLPFGPTTETEFTAVRESPSLLFLVHPSVMLHRPTVLAVGGYDPMFGAVADTELWSRVADEHQVLTVPEVLVHYRVHPASMSFVRYFEQCRFLRWTQRRQTARRNNRLRPSLADHLKWERGAFGLRRANFARVDRAAMALRQARAAATRGHRGVPVLLLALAVLLAPLRTTRRLLFHARRKGWNEATLPTIDR